MSEIASKSNTGPSASLAQPFAKKGAGAEHDLLFAALFGGVVAAGAVAVSLLVCIYCSPLAFARLRARFLLLFLRCLVGLPDSRKPISWGVRLSNPQDRWVGSILQANYTGYFLWIRCGVFACKYLLTSGAAFIRLKVIHSTRKRIGFCLG